MFTVLTWILSPVLVLFADRHGDLPWYLSYFQTFDATLPKGYWNAVKWMCRNPGYTFDLKVLGLKWVKEDWKLIKFSNPDEHHVFFLAINKKTCAFNLYYYNEDNYTMLRYVKLGWKAWNFFDIPTKTFSKTWEGTEGKVPIC